MIQPNGRLTHQALVYDSSEQFLAAAVPFVATGLHRHDAVVAVTSDANSALLRDQLGRQADDVTFIEASRWFDAPGRALAAYHRHLDDLLDRRAYLRVLGEPIWAGRDELETAEWGRYEAMVNVALASSPAFIMCGYDSRALPTTIVDDARRTHPQLALGPGSEPSEHYTDPAAYAALHDEALSPPPTDGVERLVAFEDPATVRAFVLVSAGRLGLPAASTDDFVLAVNEVATNAIRHGAGAGEAIMWATDRRVICEIHDGGTAQGDFLGFLRGEPDAERGHGLWIARQLCDLLEIRSGETGTTVRLHLRRT